MIYHSMILECDTPECGHTETVRARFHPERHGLRIEVQMPTTWKAKTIALADLPPQLACPKCLQTASE